MGFLTDGDGPLKIPSPFIRYYGGKYQSAHHYPFPLHGTVIEPFAGGAGYSLHYAQLKVILVEKYPLLAALWRYLISVKESELRAIPAATAVDDLPKHLPPEALTLVGFWVQEGVYSPRKTRSLGAWHAADPRKGWTEYNRNRLAAQLHAIRHWQIIEGNYDLAPDIEATWFIDPPYNNQAGRRYIHSTIDFPALATWCKARKGQVLVCENIGADWLPFLPYNVKHKGAKNSDTAGEALYYRAEQ